MIYLLIGLIVAGVIAVAIALAIPRMRIASFYSAIQRGDLQYLKRALDMHPQLVNTASGAYGNAPVEEAALRDKPEVVELLFKYSPDHEASGAYDALDVAANTDSREIARILLDNGVDVNHAESDGTPLHRAADWGYIEMVKLLLDRGADPNAIGYLEGDKTTPLDLALASLERGGTEEPTADKRATVEVLVSRGAKSSKQSNERIVASVREQATAVQSILRHAFQSPGSLYSAERHRILSMWLSNFIRNLEGVVTAVETGKDMGGNQISRDEILEGLQRMCGEYGRHDTLKRLEDVCGAGIRSEFEDVLRELRLLAS